MSLGAFAALGAGVEAIDKTGKAIAALEKIMGWILVQPEAAAAELASVIAEVMKAPQVVNKAVDALFSVIDTAKPQLAILGQVGDGSLLREVEDKRPHCHQIWKIADRHLWQWLARPGVDGPDAQELRDVLATLGDADEAFFRELTAFAGAIQDVANAAAQLAMHHQQSEALALMTRVAPQLFAARKRANALALQLTSMQTKFRRRALGLPPEE